MDKMRAPKSDGKLSKRQHVRSMSIHSEQFPAKKDGSQFSKIGSLGNKSMSNRREFDGISVWNAPECNLGKNYGQDDGEDGGQAG